MLIKKIEHSFESFELNILDIELKENSINGLVGKNGAGKTTFMEILSGFRKANMAFEVEGLNEKDILFVPSDLLVYDYLTVGEFLDFIIKYSDTTVSADLLLEKLNLENKANTLIEELSQGMKKKLTLVPLFTKKYSTIILDEPFNSIDLGYIYTLKKYLVELKRRTTIIISSHILDTLADICDSVILIENGDIKKHIKDSISIKKLEREIFG
ncbi:MAG: ATP-binding cassette domain-containing protein [Clostridiales bacterium]|nr:ATP-binding cassette domain-containing protein [Clostridiales bacterium]MDU3241903.1 ATP-binding cassette domain-containing protein [Clostridiales bacterium]